MLFYMTTTKANLVWEQKHTHARQAEIASQLNNLAIVWPAIAIPVPTYSNAY